MNANAVARHYGTLTPEERFRLILAANGRGDEVEKGRLAGAGERISFTMPDHAPLGFAFHELSLLIYIELMDTAALFTHALDCADAFAADEAEGEERPEAEGPAPAGKGAQKRPQSERLLDVAYATGFMLRTKADGWKLFCERLNVPAFQVWELGALPGFDRLQRALSLAERTAFSPEDFLRWLNRTRPKGSPERTDVPWTVEGIAAATESLFREQAAWWNGEVGYRP
jgi:hypothetical protein